MGRDGAPANEPLLVPLLVSSCRCSVLQKPVERGGLFYVCHLIQLGFLGSLVKACTFLLKATAEQLETSWTNHRIQFPFWIRSHRAD